MKRFCLVGLAVLQACVAFDPELAALAGDSDDPSVGLSVACEDAGEAIVRVQEYAFTNVCGCLEGEQEAAKRCTITAGTRLLWDFSGSLEHNVSSSGGFASSSDRLRGRYSVTFPTPGEYPYSCSIHAGLMSGYRIVVVAP